jgi:arylamine N-acetyltransferase
LNHAIPKLAAYLERIGFGGVARPDWETLRELQRVHVRAVPFENLDVQLRRPVSFGLDTCFDKIVRQRRGGWCFELNGLLGWALREIGFDVMRTCAGVMRGHVGDAQMGNHLCLLVRLDRPYLVDVGFGGSLLSPAAGSVDALKMRDAANKSGISVRAEPRRAAANGRYAHLAAWPRSRMRESCNAV